MTLKLYNTLTHKKEVFEPQDASNIRMYVCGPTVYDYAHIGNARPVIVFDVLFRLLRHLYGEDHVTYARNITDVDDKIIARAKEEDRAISQLTEETTRQFHDDIRALGVLMPEDINKPGAAPRFIEPRATEHIPQMIAMIERLIASGHAYEAEGHVLFDVKSKDDYGKLARRSLDEMEAGARVEVAPYKKGPMDFVLWKPSLAKHPGWESPWGRGRPGWHIECSAMSEALLGESFDIHGGGIDLVFPHHENEVAQSECAHGGKPFAGYWMHNGYLQLEGEKMSKSLGNFVTMRDVLREWHGDVARYAMLMTHYRQPINWTNAGLKEAKDELYRWAIVLTQSQAQNDAYLRAAQRKPPEPSPALVKALSDDLNTPAAIRVLRSNCEQARSDNDAALSALMSDCEFLGILRHDKLWLHHTSVTSEGSKSLAASFYDEVQRLRVYIANNLSAEMEELIFDLRGQGVEAEISDDGFITLKSLDEKYVKQEQRIEGLIDARNEARKAKDFAEADRIRDELVEMGVALKDGPDGTTWDVVR